ncbi:MAG TPA: energy transducer TonB [Candidatus Eremiobacteraceae bacterium]|nr:energy transducer TonB [Candidatus Eremiobacteraceae bacterium]
MSAVVIGAWLAMCAATPAPTPTNTQIPAITLDGIAVGSPVLDASRRLGFPDGGAFSTNAGSIWRWTNRDGLDIEIYTDDQLVIQSITVTREKADSKAEPSEIPLLGLDASAAASAALAAGAGPLVTTPKRPNAYVWPLRGGYLDAETDGQKVVRLRALDPTFARRWRYAGEPLAVVPVYTAPDIVMNTIAHPLPAGQGSDLILVSLDASGKVVDAKVIVGSGDSDVDNWSLRCVRVTIFKPATCAGVPCPGNYIYSGGLQRSESL